MTPQQVRAKMAVMPLPSRPPRNNGIHIKGTRSGGQWFWRVYDLTKGPLRSAPWVHFLTQKEAIAYGRELAVRCRCELVIHGKDGKIRRKDSFGRDPRKRKG